MDANAPKLRLCCLRKWPDFQGYGFNLHAEKGKAGQFIGKVDDDSPSVSGGLREHDKVIEVNGVSVATETHAQVVQRIKEHPDHVELLVADRETENYYVTRGIVMTSSLSSVEKFETSATRYENSNGNAKLNTEPVKEENHYEDAAGAAENEAAVASIAAAVADLDDLDTQQDEERAPTPPQAEPPAAAPAATSSFHLDSVESTHSVEAAVPTHSAAAVEHHVVESVVSAPAAAALPTIEPVIQQEHAPAPVAAAVQIKVQSDEAALRKQDFNISAAEARARIANNKRNSAKQTNQTFRDKYNVFQSL